MIRRQFSWKELNDNGVEEERDIKEQLPLHRENAYLVKPKCLDRRFQKILQDSGFDLDKQVKVYQPDPPPPGDFWMFEQT
jgi:hypothetical protein